MTYKSVNGVWTCEHTYANGTCVEEVITAATCLAAGEKLVTCNCGEVYKTEEIEEYLGKIESIKECVVVGRDKGDGSEIMLTAVVFPDFDAYPKDEPIDNIAEDIKKQVLELNRGLPSFKQIRNIDIRKTEFEKTTTRKIKRFLVK